MVFLIGSIVLTLLIAYAIPRGSGIRHRLFLLSTLVHEMGHGIASLLCGYQFIEFKMFEDGSGVAYTEAGKGNLAKAFTAMGGLVGPAVVAGGLFVLGRDERKSRITLMLSAIVLLLSVVFLVRNWFGVLYISVTALVLLLIASKAKPWVSQLAVLFIAAQLALSVFTDAGYLFTETAVLADGSRLPSDVGQMAEALFLPYWFWGAFCALFSVSVLFIGLKGAVRDR